MKANNIFQQNNYIKKMKSEKRIKNLKKSNSKSSFYNQIQKAKLYGNKYNDINERKKNINYTFVVPNKVMKTIVDTMNKNKKVTLSSINNLNSINFFYQTYERGIDLLKHKFNCNNKASKIDNYFKKQNIVTNLNQNYYSTIIGNRPAVKEMYANYKKYNNEELKNFSESFYKGNNSNLITPSNSFRNFPSIKSMDKTYNNSFNKKNRKIFSTINNNSTKKFIIKRNNSYKFEKNNNKNNKNTYTARTIRYKLLSNNNNINDSSNDLKNFGFVPVRNIDPNYKKYIKNSASVSVSPKKINFSIYKRIKKSNNEIVNKLKNFTDKYEKEKENFNNVLFDECIELRTKKFKLETFLKKFTNKQFVEKLYKAKEYSIKKKI